MTLPRQQEIPGTEAERLPDIEEAAMDLHEVRSQRMELSKEEKQKAERLRDLMKKREVEEHAFVACVDGVDKRMVARIKVTKERVSVRAAEADDADEAEIEAEG